MNRIDRLFGVLTVLQSGKFATAGYLSEKFKISVRTVYRDIRALEELGTPIGFEPNKGYFIVEGYFLPPLSLSVDEANALILMASLSEKFADRSIDNHCQNAILKLKTILECSQKEKANHFSSNISVWSTPDQISDKKYISKIQRAIVNKRILEIEYTNNNNRSSSRQVEPIGLSFYSNQWHLIAWCWKRTEYRDFKIKMISKLIETSTPFKKKEHLTINEYIQQLK